MAKAGTFAAVLLAAGSSTRLGRPKQNVKVGGESLVRRAALQLLKLEPAQVIVVTGSGGGAVEEGLRGLHIECAQNELWEQGIGSSIAHGAGRVAEDVSGVLIALCDQWRVDENDLGRLTSAWLSDISRIFASCWFEEESFVYGPPVLFPRKYIRELEKLTGDHGAKPIIAANLEEVTFVAMDNAACDLDTRADLEHLFTQAGQNPSN